MIRFVAKRVAISVLMLIAASLLIFVVLRLLPGSPITSRLASGTGITQARLEELRKQAGLSDPLAVQYWHWVSGAVHGDFGKSYFSDYSVTQLIGQRLPETIELTVIAMVFTVVLAVPASLAAVRRPRGVIDRVISALSSAGLAFPQFIVGITLIVIFGVKMKIFPTIGYTPLSDSISANLHDMVLPSLTLAVAAAPLLFRYLRTALLEVLQSPHIRTATGKGVSASRVLLDHALRNAAPPGLTMLGLLVGYTLGGVVVIEYVFGLPGLGSLAVNSVLDRDYAVLQSTVLLIAALFIVTNLVVDLVIGVLDPRLRAGAARD